MHHFLCWQYLGNIDVACSARNIVIYFLYGCLGSRKKNDKLEDEMEIISPITRYRILQVARCI